MLKMKQNVKVTAGTDGLFLLSIFRTQEKNKERKVGNYRFMSSRNMLRYSDISWGLDEFTIH